MRSLLVFILSISCFSGSEAQTIPAFRQLRFDEDYSMLKFDSSENWYRQAKYNELSKKRNVYISLGGDIRYQYLWFKNENWGESPADKDGYILTRYLAHADLHIGKHFRTFIQLQSSLATGKEEPPSPVDENQLDLHQAFVDLALLKNKLTVRAGRQEFLYGSQRLIAVRDGPNNRQSFDAIKVMYAKSKWNVDLFFSHHVRSKPKIFDDGFNRNTKLWGAYLVRKDISFLKNIDVYYLGLWKKETMFNDGFGKETRHSAGSRIWSDGKKWRYDIEGLYQFGQFGKKRISAWTFSVNTVYKFIYTNYKPAVGLKTELITGDACYGDNKLQSFNPLFPRGGYFGLVSLIGPVNLFDIHPSLVLDLSRKLFLNMDYDIFWRFSKQDGIYGPGVFLLYPGKNSSEKYIGSQYSTDLVYVPNNFLYFRGEFTWFKSGKYLKDVGPGKDILFVAFTAQLKF